ncbi:MAG: hypothetical protein ABIT07_05430 [Ferruginibacter sp.]
MFSFITNILEPLSYLVYFIGIAIYYKQQPLAQVKVLLIYYFVAAVLMAYASVLARSGKENVFVYNYFFLPLSIFSLTLYFFFTLNDRKKKIAILFLTFNFSLFLVKLFFFRSANIFDSIGFALLSLSIVALSFVYFRQLLTNVSEISVLKKYDFWIVSGYIVSFSGSFIVFLTYYYLTKKILATYTKEERYLLTFLWGIPNFLFFIGALSTLTGILWINYRRKLRS